MENGLTLTDLRDLANLAGYQSSMGKVKFQDLAESKVPVIVGITIRKHDHFAVFRGTDGYYVYLADPIRGNIRVPIPEFLEQWQKNAILVVAKPNSKVKNDQSDGHSFYRGLSRSAERSVRPPQLHDDPGAQPGPGRARSRPPSTPLVDASAGRVALRSSRPAWPPFASPQGLLRSGCIFGPNELPLSKYARPTEDRDKGSAMSDISEPSSTEFRADRLEFLGILGLAPPVTEEDVKQAYLVKARTAHPDQGGSVEKFKRAPRGI